jgi:hypothetical protein
VIDWQTIDRLAKLHAKEDAADSPESFRRFLEFWWCVRYNRPFKDPLLKQYETEALFYEWRRIHYLTHDPRVEEQKATEEADDMAWMRAELEKIKQQAQKIAEKTDPPEPPDPETPAIPDIQPVSLKFEP